MFYEIKIKPIVKWNSITKNKTTHIASIVMKKYWFSTKLKLPSNQYIILLESTLGEIISIKLIKALIKLEIITPVKTIINEF